MNCHVSYTFIVRVSGVMGPSGNKVPTPVRCLSTYLLLTEIHLYLRSWPIREILGKGRPKGAPLMTSYPNVSLEKEVDGRFDW